VRANPVPMNPILIFLLIRKIKTQKTGEKQKARRIKFAALFRLIQK
jgi:hypothetical protein